SRQRVVVHGVGTEQPRCARRTARRDRAVVGLDRRGGDVMWRLLDPFLVKIARRMEHLAIHHPSDYLAGVMRGRGTFSSEAIASARARVQIVATPEHLEVGDDSDIEGEGYRITAPARCGLGNHRFPGAEEPVW